MPLLRSCRSANTTPEQSAQIRSLEPVYLETHIIARPCAVTMKDGTIHERAYLVESLTCYSDLSWWLDIRDVADIRESPHRLPAQLAAPLYSSGETSMGAQRYSIEFQDGPVVECVNDLYNCDFPDLPTGYDISMIKSIHVPSDKRTPDYRSNHKCPTIAFWFHDKPRHTFRRLLRGWFPTHPFFTNP